MQLFATGLRRIRRHLLDRCILRPTRQPIDYGVQTKENVRAGKWMLDVFWQTNQPDGTTSTASEDGQIDLLILKFPGTGGRAERSSSFPIKLLQPEQITISMGTWNPPGYGTSLGRATLQNISDASVALCEELMQRCSPKRVWLVGNSLGCAAAMNVAANCDFEGRQVGLLLRNAPPLKPVFRAVARRYPLGRLALPWADCLVESMDIMESATVIPFPAVFLQSELDRLVPLEMQQEVVQRYAGSTRSVVLKGLDHAGVATDEHATVIAEALQWLWETS